MAQFSASEEIANGYRDFAAQQRACGLKFIEEISSKPGSVVLDMGCGPGDLTAVLAKQVGPTGRVVGVDPDAGRIKVASDSFKDVPNISFVEGSTDNFPNMEGEFYDVYFSNHVIHRVQNKLAAFQNAYKCLKPGGTFAIHISTGISKMGMMAIELFHPECYDTLVKKMYRFEGLEAITEYCKKAGFESVEVRQDLARWSFPSREDFLKWFSFSQHGVFDLKRVTKELMEKYNPPRDENGLPLFELPEIWAVAVKA